MGAADTWHAKHACIEHATLIMTLEEFAKAKHTNFAPETKSGKTRSLFTSIAMMALDKHSLVVSTASETIRDFR